MLLWSGQKKEFRGRIRRAENIKGDFVRVTYMRVTKQCLLNLYSIVSLFAGQSKSWAWNEKNHVPTLPPWLSLSCKDLLASTAHGSVCAGEQLANKSKTNKQREESGKQSRGRWKEENIGAATHNVLCSTCSNDAAVSEQRVSHRDYHLAMLRNNTENSSKLKYSLPAP